MSEHSAENGEPELVRSRDGLVWRVTGKRYVRASRKPYLIEVVGVESGLPNAFGVDEVTVIPPGEGNAR